MKRHIVCVLVAGVLVSSCATVTLPVNRKVPVKQACGPLADRKCAPSVGVPLPLTQQYKTIEVDATGTPLLMSYLGTMVDLRNRRGEFGAICGGNPNPFKATDRTASLFTNTVELTYTLEQKIDAGIKADLTEAMVAAGVPISITDRVQAELDASVSQLKKQVVNATATLNEYQLKPTVLSELDGSEERGRFKKCLSDLMTGKWRLYQGVSGFYVSDGRLDSTTTSTIIANLVARVKLVDPSVDTFKVTASLNKTVTQKVKTAVRPYFVVVGVSFYRSPRHSMIS
ncbi:MAG: hypothetical protein HEQ34_13120 [Sphingorhabdus sp.]|uniref:hypothetical protein n=1 Tax=Sphingorhabdus sp. TaxID=1902408 RepID=UPI0025EDAE2E|nr:hypothetical protein [Sphingorhabdus sp.]MCO4092874.1 hypothetical protein [Sphingorhabdus sp.]